MTALDNLSHPQKVLLLYKFILKLHRSLPSDLKEVGNRYVREEFRKHKNANPEYTRIFMREWTQYATDLSAQINQSIPRQPRPSNSENDTDRFELGKSLDENRLNCFSESQLMQLYSLAQSLHIDNKQND